MEKSVFYDKTKLLSLKDINGNTPEIYICTSNRTAGKTTAFNSWFLRRFRDHGEKFMLIFRNKYEIENAHENFFKKIQEIYFPADEMTSKLQRSGQYAELFFNSVSCGYAVALSTADKIKNLSQYFSDVERMLFDEFMPESNQYLPDEPGKLFSIHTSVARGVGKMVRYVPVYMISNPVTILNPYYSTWGITDRLNKNTKFIRGNGWVLEQGHNKAAAQAQKTSAFNQAYLGSQALEYSAEGTYLLDKSSFVEKISAAKSKYICTLKVDGKQYAIRELTEQGIIYADDRPDMTYPIRITTTLDDHSINFVMLRNNDILIQRLRFFFQKGCFRFRNLATKNAVIKTLAFYY